MDVSQEQQEAGVQTGTPINEGRGGGSQTNSPHNRPDENQNLENINSLKQEILELKTRLNQLETTPTNNAKQYEWMDGFYDPENAKRIQEKWGNN